MTNPDDFLNRLGMTPDDQARAEIAPFAATIAALHHELADKDVPLESAHLYVTKWMDSIIRWSR